VNGKHRKKKIFQLEHDEGTIVGEENLKVSSYEYYKNTIWGTSSKYSSLKEDFNQDVLELAPEEKKNILFLLCRERIT
jgi:hypothetical protein